MALTREIEWGKQRDKQRHHTVTPESTLARINAHLVKVGECIEWAGMRRNGYGVISFRSRGVPVHRLRFEIAFGHVPTNLVVCHRCDNRACVNIEHLFLGTQKENMRDAAAKGRLSQRNAVKGERIKWAKLTNVAVREIRVLHVQGVSKAEIARQYGCARTSIRRIVDGTNWKHVT